QHKVQGSAPVLEDRRINMRHTIYVETILLDVLNDAGDRVPGIKRIFTQSNPPSHGIAVRPKPPGCAFVNDYNWEFICLVTLSEKDASHERRLNDFEITRADSN